MTNLIQRAMFWSKSARSKNMRNYMNSLWRDQQGVSTIEFAIFAPVFMALLLGMLWITDSERVSTQASLVSSTVSDLIARAEVVTEAEIDRTLFAADAMMGPHADDLQIYVVGIANTVVSYNSDGTANFKPVVAWVRERNIIDLPVPNVGDEYPVQQSLVDVVPFVVSTKVKINHTPVFGSEVLGDQVYEYEHTFAPRADITANCEDC